MPNMYRIAKDKTDLDQLNIIKTDYNIVEESEENFNFVRNDTKYPIAYNNGIISYGDVFPNYFASRESIQKYLENFNENIKVFLDQNKTHPQFNMWNDYYNQLNDLIVELSNLEFNDLNFPTNKSLVQYFDDLGKLSLSPLQLP